MDHPPGTSFARWLRERRRSRALSQAALAAQVGCALSMLQKIEQGMRRPSPALAERMLDALAVPAGERGALLRLACGLPAAPTAAPPPREPPPRPTTMLGRDAERAALRRLVGGPERQLISIVGPGGIGKTSLALELAADLAASPALPDGAAVALLGSISAARDVPLAVAAALGLELGAAPDAAAALLDALRGLALLLVLDNCEHLLGPGDGELLVGLVGQILAGAPGVRLVATSRERLRLRAERVLELGGLELPGPGDGPQVARSAAAQLFVAAASRADPGFALRADNRAAVAQICRQLDGVPLAIELAAAWVRALAPHEIAAALSRSLDLLTSADRDAPARHRSVRTSLDHSWRLIGPEERRALAGLSVFVGGCDLEAAEAVLGPGPAGEPLVGTLAALIDKSLLRREAAAGGTRYTLHALVGQYAAERLGEEPLAQAAAAARHRAYFAGLLQRAVAGSSGALAAEARARLNREIDNLRAAWAHSAAGDSASLEGMIRGIWVLCEANSWLLEGAALFAQAAAALPSDGRLAGLRGYLMMLQAMFLGRLGRLGQARPLLEAGMALTRSSPALAGLADLSLSLGMFELNCGDVAAARALLARAAAQARDDHYVGLWAELFVGLIARYDGDYVTAEESYRRCRELWRRDGFARGEAAALAYLGDLARLQGRRQAASAHLRAGIQIASAHGDRWALALALGMLGGLAAEQGELAEADYLLTEGVAIVRELNGEPWLLGSMLCGLAGVACARGRLRESRGLYAEVLSLVRAGTGILAGELIYGLGLLYERAGDRDTALALMAAVEHSVAERAVRRAAAARQAALAAQGLAGEAAQRPLLDWLEELCARPLSAPASAQPSGPAGALPLANGEALSAREVEVLRLIVAGASNQRIAESLVISRHTAKHHVASILAKLGVSSRAAAAVAGRELGL